MNTRSPVLSVCTTSQQNSAAHEHTKPSSICVHYQPAHEHTKPSSVCTTSHEHTKPSSICVHYQPAEQCSTWTHETQFCVHYQPAERWSTTKARNIRQDPKLIQQNIAWCALCASWYCYWSVSPMEKVGHFWDRFFPRLKVTGRDRK
jgi:hypothetical protein